MIRKLIVHHQKKKPPNKTSYKIICTKSNLIASYIHIKKIEIDTSMFTGIASNFLPFAYLYSLQKLYYLIKMLKSYSSQNVRDYGIGNTGNVLVIF